MFAVIYKYLAHYDEKVIYLLMNASIIIHFYENIVTEGCVGAQPELSGEVWFEACGVVA
jgi:hypothetical protein